MDTSQLIESYSFSKLILDSIREQIVVIDQGGKILFCNRAWVEFGEKNGYLSKYWLGTNYLKACDDAAVSGDELGKTAAHGIREVIAKRVDEFYLEYPCHSPDEKRWFMMRVTPLFWEGAGYLVVSHRNITERKMIEEQIVNLSRLDGLTNITNRKYFDEFLDEEWRRCARLDLPITLALLDVDHFKLLNDYYGHQAGDDCLIKIGEAMSKIINRPSDLSARFGGDEFSLTFGNTTIEQALVLINKFVKDIHDLKIPNEQSPTNPLVTVSIGLGMMKPNRENNIKDLISLADKHLYLAKDLGRNRVIFKAV